MRESNVILKKFGAGFTLTELLIVVIIVGIIGTLALPMLVKTMEKAKLGEAASNLNLIRTGEKIYFLEYGTFVMPHTELNIEDPNEQANRYFQYSVDPVTGEDFRANATRREGRYVGKAVHIDKSGAITADDGYFTP